MNNEKKPVGSGKKIIERIRSKIKTFYSDYEEKRARRDIIFKETITKKEEPKMATPAKRNEKEKMINPRTVIS